MSGRITDAASGAGLSYTSVVARSESGAGSTGILADEEGRYRLELAAGAWLLTFHYIGYSRLEQRVVVVDGVEIPVDAALTAEAIPLEPHEVLGEPIAPGDELRPSRQTLEGDRILALPAFGEPDPIRTLEFLPGVQTASDVSTGLYVRGGGPDQTLILLDEIPIYNPTHAFGLFSTFNADFVRDVTLWKGAYPARYGGRLGSVLDVRHRDGDADEVRGRIGVTTVSGRLSMEGPVGERGSWIAGARRTYLDPILDALRTDENDLPAYWFYDTNLKVRLPGAGGSETSFSAYVGDDDLRIDFDRENYLDLTWGNRAASVKHRRLLRDRFLGSITVFGSEYRSRTDVSLISTPIAFENRLRDVSLKMDLTYEESEEHRVSGGLQVSAYDHLLRQTFNSEDQTSFESRPLDVSVFLEDDWRPGGAVSVREGLRVRWLSEGSRLLLEPRASATWGVRDDVTLTAGGGLYHQFLQLVTTEGFSGTDFYVPLDESVDPGTAWQIVGGLEWTPDPEWRLTAESYGTLLRNLVLLDAETTTDGPEDDAEALLIADGRGWAAGLELFAERRLGPVQGWIGYTLGWTRRTFEEVNGGRSFAPKYDRRHDLNVVGLWERGAWSFSSAFIFGTGQAFTPASARFGIRNPATGNFPDDAQFLPGDKNSARLLPYHRLDVSVRRDFTLAGRTGQWLLQVFNVYSWRNEWFVQYDDENGTADPQVVKMLPIIPSLGVSLDF